jgi:ribosomal protein S18 acetylase RimI-like enzyme
LDDEEIQYAYKQYPAVKIARLLVDARQRNLGIGESLVELALGTTKGNVCPFVGCRFVVVDSKEEAVSFYERRGFTLLDTPENKKRSEPIMFIDLYKIPEEANS